ncbi:arf-GAP with Rho-GAP domain, ANK repeat and PH domain-containing protein 2 [Protopterus annectens]|uniref:arf-GAP with Rho-GAP domain, ANK repeat and PH domain-containing protein 2 n=1 Tax=Protopterus annectens TaxID=7888 RepID=UPI001CF98DBE|nr:arf-GAP with Rho-GAP domain, ANK repeat and PH domain-containing protein 2 [Protopterus annectens]
MSSAPEMSGDVENLLASVHLEQYAQNFKRAGYVTIKHCSKVNNDVLKSIGITLTGHRKRILKQIQLALSEESQGVRESNIQEDGKNTQLPHPDDDEHTGEEREIIMYGNSATKPLKRNVFEGGCLAKDTFRNKENDSSLDRPDIYSLLQKPREAYQQAQSLESGTPNVFDYVRGKVDKKSAEQHFDENKSHSLYTLSPSTSSAKKAPENIQTTCEMSDCVENRHSDLELFNFKGEMIENELYEELQTSPDAANKSDQKPSRSFKLRHRPVPEIPSNIPKGDNRFLLQRRNVDLPNLSENSSSSKLAKSQQVAQQTNQESTLSPISPYGEAFLYDSPEYLEEISSGDFPATTEETERESETNETQDLYIPEDGPASDFSQQRCNFSSQEDLLLSNSPDDECAQTAVSEQPQQSSSFTYQKSEVENGGCAVYNQACPPPHNAESETNTNNAAVTNDSQISPYACFYGPSSKKKEGWLDKLSPQGNYMFQKRWVRFDGHSLAYYNNEKDMYSKGIIPISAISNIRGIGDNKFEVTTSNRTFIFRAEKEGDRNEWMEAVFGAITVQSQSSQTTCNSLERCGNLELKGHKSKIHAVLTNNKLWLYKNYQDFKTGLGITVIELNVATVKDLDRKNFELTTPFKSFCFTAESEKEKQEWIEAFQESIAETLSDYEVAEKIWFNESNRSCADCRAPGPEWASINLVVVICKKCAGPHRSLGPRISKVRSLKLDTHIWSNELVEMFIVVGNKIANSFWSGDLQPCEELDMDASSEERKMFITQKYKEGRFRKKIYARMTQDELNQALCAAVVKQDILETMSLVFSGADVMCATGDPDYSTPYLLAQKTGQRLQMEFLHHNKLSDVPKLETHSPGSFQNDSSLPTFVCSFLYKAVNTSKPFIEKKPRDEMSKKWCTLEGGFLSYYENDKATAPNGMIDINEVVCLAVTKPESITHAGALFTFEIYLLSERVFLFGAETVDLHRDWTRTIAKGFVPGLVEKLARKDYELIGKLFYKDCQSLEQWKIGWFVLNKPWLWFCQEDESAKEESVHLKRLQELTVCCTQDGSGEKTDILLLVEKGRTLYVHGYTKLDFMVWHSAIQKAASTDGNALRDQQLNKNDVPIIVDSCIAFVTQHGLGSEGIYKKNGNPSRVSHLLDQFRKDARNVKLRGGEHHLEDVTDVLIRFLYETDDALLTKELYPYWISALDTQDEKGRVERYITFTRTLPRVNRTTLAALIGHLYRVQKCSAMNQMNSQNLAMVFSNCLFQTEGHNSSEVSVVEDLIDNYVQLFDVNEEQVKQMDIENSFITKWKDTQISQAGDLLIEIYFEKRESDSCSILRVSPAMSAEEMATCVLETKNIVPEKNEIWCTFEVIENGELERPLHYKEKVLEQVLLWSSLEEPGSAYLIVKRCPDLSNFTNHIVKNTSETIKTGSLKCKEEPSKLLSGNKFQERYFVLRVGKLLLFKDSKNNRPEKEIYMKSLKFYLGIKKRMKPPTNWGLTLFSEKQQWHMCCDGPDTQKEWMASLLVAQYGSDLWPAVVKECQMSPTINPVVGGMSLIPVQPEKPKSLHTEQADCSQIDLGMLKLRLSSVLCAREEQPGCLIKPKVSVPAHGQEYKDGSSSSQKQQQCLGLLEKFSLHDLQARFSKESKDLNSSEKSNKAGAEETRLPPNVMQELNAVLQKQKRTLKEE